MSGDEASSKNEKKHPWIAGGLTIAKSIIDRVDEEALAAYTRDEESCGLLLGPAGDDGSEADALVVDEIVTMENRANKLHKLDPETYPRTGRMYFDLDPLKFQRAVAAGETNGRPVKVLYHSHLDVGAYFSETDATAATMGGDSPAYDLAYLVTSVRGGGGTTPKTDDPPRVDDRKLFIWDAASRSFVETTFVVSL